MTETVVRRRRTGGYQGFTTGVFREEDAKQHEWERGWSILYFLPIFNEQSGRLSRVDIGRCAD